MTEGFNESVQREMSPSQTGTQTAAATLDSPTATSASAATELEKKPRNSAIKLHGQYVRELVHIVVIVNLFMFTIILRAQKYTPKKSSENAYPNTEYMRPFIDIPVYTVNSRRANKRF